MRFQMLPRGSWPDFLDLPWSEPLESWQSPRLVEVARGISRHVVRFVDYDGALYALKELPEPLAEREYRLLRELAAELLHRRWYRSEAAGHDVGMADGVATFSQQVLPEVPDEKATLGSPT